MHVYRLQGGFQSAVLPAQAHVCACVRSKRKRGVEKTLFEDLHRNFSHRSSKNWHVHLAETACRAASTLNESPNGSDETRATAVQRLMSWLVANGVEGIGREDSSLGIYTDESGQRGVLFLKDAPEGAVVARIPLRLAITDHSQRGSAAPIVDEPADVRLARRLIEQADQGEASPWYPFIQAMPESVASPYGQWPEEATRQLQLGAVPPDLQHALNSGSQHGSVDPQLRWALSMVHSRSFATAGASEAQAGVQMLVPLADMLNHGGDVANFILPGESTPTENVRWEVVDSGQSGWTFQVLTTCAVSEGEEALLKYVPGYPGWSFLLHCGFVPIRNPHESVRLFGGVAEAVDWYMDRFPPMGDAAHLKAQACQRAATSARPLPEGASRDPAATAERDALIVTARLGVDARLLDAFSYLAEDGNGTEEKSDMGMRKAKRLVSFRIAELLFAPQVTSLLTDLKLLAASELEDAYDRQYYAALVEHYQKAVELLDAKYGDFKTMARLMNPSPPSQPNQEEAGGTERGPVGFSYPCLMALRLRASQKQVAWEVMLSLLASEN